jgi:hypothetical protein
VSAKEKAEIIALVTGSELPCRRALAQLGLARSKRVRISRKMPRITKPMPPIGMMRVRGIK